MSTLVIFIKVKFNTRDSANLQHIAHYIGSTNYTRAFYFISCFYRLRYYVLVRKIICSLYFRLKTVKFFILYSMPIDWIALS